MSTRECPARSGGLEPPNLLIRGRSCGRISHLPTPQAANRERFVVEIDQRSSAMSADKRAMRSGIVGVAG